MGIATHPLFGSVIDCFMHRVLIPDALVGGPFVREDIGGIGSDIFVDDGVKGLVVRTRGNLQANLSFALDESDNGALVGRVPVALAPPFPSYESLVHVNLSAQLLSIDFGAVARHQAFPGRPPAAAPIPVAGAGGTPILTFPRGRGKGLVFSPPEWVGCSAALPAAT